MKTGPKPTPVAVQEFRGNVGHKTKAELEAPLAADVICDVTPPEILDETAVTEWNRVAPILTKYRILSDLDKTTLALYCQSWADYCAYTEVVRRDGTTYETPMGQIKTRPEVAMRRNAWQEIIRVSLEFGFSPSSRAGLQVNFQTIKKSIKESLDELEDCE